MTQSGTTIETNLARIRQAIGEAASRAGRDPAQVTLVGVTKYVPAEQAVCLRDAGLFELAESRPQELWRKAQALPPDPSAIWPASVAGPAPRWHLIGHLQRNKLARTLPLVGLWHSGDSPRVLEEAHAWARAAGRTVPTLIEVNTAAEPAKHGFAPEQLEPLGELLAGLTGLQIHGLMTMAPLDSDPQRSSDKARRSFEALQELAHRLRSIWPAQLGLHCLSMGMSGDFQEAIAAGATIVRIGSALFEGL